MRTVYIINCITISLMLSACGGSGGGSEESKATPSPSTPGIVAPPVVTTPSTPATSSLTYYTLVKTANVSQGGHTYPITMTGHCVVYNSQDYCWDDGFQTIVAINYKTSFWQLVYASGAYGQGNGGVDAVTTPALWTSMAAHLPTPPYQPSDVYTQGISTGVTCTTNGTIIDCVDFAIDTSTATL